MLGALSALPAAGCSSRGTGSRLPQRSLGAAQPASGGRSRLLVQATATAKKDKGKKMEPALLKTYTLQEMTYAQTRKLMERPRVDFSSILDTVRALPPRPSVCGRQGEGSLLNIPPWSLFPCR